MTNDQRKKEVERLTKIGGKGGRATKKKLGKDHYKKIGSLGGTAKWKKI